MSVREDRDKSSSSSRGLGLAAAAIGVGVGAALYYFFNNRAENHPDTEGSTQNWQCTENFSFMDTSASDDSYSTISEHSTSDTSIASSDSEDSSDAQNENRMRTDSDSSEDSDESIDSASLNDASGETDSTGSDLGMEWDVTTSSLDVPHEQRLLSLSPLHFLTRIVTGEFFAENGYAQNNGLQKNDLRTQAFRKRTNSLEECSICFEVVLKDQEVMSLPCTHNFHTKCILPWLQEQQTCPNCRQAI